MLNNDDSVIIIDCSAPDYSKQGDRKMNTNSKQEQYNALCADMREYYSNLSEKDRTVTVDGKEMVLEWCDFCKEVNLWTYWQGRNTKGSNSLNPKILLVGQDWGSLDDKYSQVFENVKAMNKGNSVHYMYGHHNDTDDNLIELFKHIAYDVLDGVHEKLFFTNVFPLYRPKGCKISGGYKSTWMSDAMKEHFKRLVDILKPQIIICLGKETYLSVGKSLLGDRCFAGRNHSKYNYNQIIEESLQNPLTTEDGAKIFALSHCGALGVMNRGRGSNTSKNGFEIQKSDWEKVAKHIESQSK